MVLMASARLLGKRSENLSFLVTRDFFCELSTVDC